MCLIARNSNAFKSAKLKKKMFTYDKTDPINLKLPSVIETIEDDILFNFIPTLVEKYRLKNYKMKDREELEDEKDWSDLELLYLVKFYKNDWSFIIPNENEFFPHFVFTYNIAPLKEQIDKIISHLHDKLHNFSTFKAQLENTFTYSTLEVTYLLHYFALIHPDYEEE